LRHNLSAKRGSPTGPASPPRRRRLDPHTAEHDCARGTHCGLV